MAVVEISMYSKIALASSTLVFHFLRLSSSICIENQNDSIIALSRPSPTLPKDGMRPAERILSPKAQEVNWTPCVHDPAGCGTAVAVDQVLAGHDTTQPLDTRGAW